MSFVVHLAAIISRAGDTATWPSTDTAQICYFLARLEGLCYHKHATIFSENDEVERIMEITKIEIRPMQDEGNLKAFCSVIFDDVFIVHSVKVIEGRNGLFVAMPSRKENNGEFRDIAHPIDNSFRLSLEEQVLHRYQEEMGCKGNGAKANIITEDVSI
jgi:stage V sporulation protein G